MVKCIQMPFCIKVLLLFVFPTSATCYRDLNLVQLSAIVIKKIIISLATQCSPWDSGKGFTQEHVRNAEP